MDIKAKVDEVVGKVKNDPEFAKKFAADPVKAVESVTGVDLPDEQINRIIGDVKTKALSGGVNGIADKLSGLTGMLGGKKE